jgi:hypothetical protein
MMSNGFSVRVLAYSDRALDVLSEHILESRRFKNKVSLRLMGVKQELVGNTLFISFGKLMEKIIKKGGSFGGVDDLKRSDFLRSIDDAMIKAGVELVEYEVIFDE